MADILVRNLDEDTARRLKEKAKAEGKSLGATVREVLAQAAKPTKAELVAEARRIRAMSPYSDVDSTDLIREDRENDEPYR
jgi:plasmid stability protein